ncbi:potassium-transporting ATPase subunit KdpA [Dietzia alimentaria]|uniref:potassium-transporting ATPase subunit KdpA n=1 Tax=Dietzia alimentaria TaxID=665550 RepID=UPI00029AE09C|nr:potassium-transporting ATPase subunit KdpA [Dietzia alimentaria]
MSPAIAAGLQVAALLALLACLYVPLGDHMARVFSSERDLKVERLVYRVLRVDARREQTWRVYALSVIAFSALSFLALYALQRAQHLLPSMGTDHVAVDPPMAFNTAASFVTNTNWQSYLPEGSLTNLTQMAGLTVQNVVSAAVGICVAIAVVRGLCRVRTDEIGNFWVDLTRAIIRVLLPVSMVFAVLFLSQGVVQSFGSGAAVTALDGTAQTIATAPAASQEAIKLLGTNGGGIFGANSAHPFENPTPVANLLSILALLCIPVCLTRTFGTMLARSGAGSRAHGLTILGVMAGLWASMLAVVTWAEYHAVGVAAGAAGAQLEGKEVRMGIPGSTLFAVSTTGTSTGAVNSAHDSYSALGGGALILNMLFGEVAPGGVGTGLYGILVLAVLAVFVGGLLVGRTPEFLGKKIGRREITCASLSLLVMPVLVLTGVAVTALLPAALDAQGNSGDPGSPNAAHGLSEYLYAFASAANNNGSAFGGLTVTDHWFQAALGVVMMLGRFLPIILVLAMAGAFAAQSRSTPGPGTLPTNRPLFAGLLAGVILLVAALTFLPVLTLGPIAEALQ